MQLGVDKGKGRWDNAVYVPLFVGSGLAPVVTKMTKKFTLPLYIS